VKREVAAFQGEPGAFSQQAVWRLLGPGTKVLPCPTFRQVFEAVREGRATAAVIPIENTLHGSVHENYDHLLAFDLKIVAENRLRIVHNLIAPPGVKWPEVRTVFSHPVALNQCLKFFAAHPHLARESFYDTAGSVKMLMRDRPPGAAAIASEMAAEIYGARILKRSIEDDRENYTRFFLLRPPGYRVRTQMGGAAGPAKTSVVFAVRDTPGALFRALGALALRDLSIAKIESRPIKGRPWEYLFYLDFHGNVAEPRVGRALAHLEELADFVRVLGCYRAAAAGDAAPRRAASKDSSVRRKSGAKRSV
jgi:prephenate dehydratase